MPDPRGHRPLAAGDGAVRRARNQPRRDHRRHLHRARRPPRRWLIGLVYAECYLVLALFGVTLVSLFGAMPPALITTVAGAALIGPLAGALAAAADERQRFAAVLALAVTASGVSAGGVGAPLWGLVAGMAAIGLDRLTHGHDPGAMDGSASSD